MTELRRLVRLSPDVVVTGHGPIGDLELLRDTHGALGRAKNAIAELVDSGRLREDVLESVRAIGRGLFSDATSEHLYDEHVGILPAAAFIERVGLREGPSPTAGNSGWKTPQTIVVADLWPGRTEQIGLAAPGVEVFVARDTEHAANLVDEEDADAILGWLTPQILERGNNLRWVSLFSAGIESYLDLPGFRDSEIVLTNGQRLYANGGAEHVLGTMLALSRRLNTAVQLQSERRWDTAPLTGPTPITGDGSELGELRGKTMLVAGLGGIGTEVARLAHGIGMRVIATRASRREGPPFVEYVGLAHELPQLASEPDVIVNCLPLTPETEGVFDEGFFRQAKPTAYFINIGRGKTVDTEALVRALREGEIRGAALDVTEPEPLPADHELWAMPNVIITPHVGGDSERHMERIWLLFRENLRRFSVGEPLLSVVNKRRGY
jgi:phosphoglycerate dehydrogenase-like enzyme